MMYKISGIVCIVLMLFFVGMLMWDCNEEGKQEDDSIVIAGLPTQEDYPTLDGEIDNLKVSYRTTSTIPLSPQAQSDEILILSREEALELRHKFPIGSYTYFFKDLQWPITQSLAIDSFIEWLYLNDYEIVRKK